MKGFVRKLLNDPRHLSLPQVARSNSVVNATDARVVASKLGLGRSASSFTKHRVGAYIRSTVYGDIISCWSLLYGVYDGGK